MHIVPLIVGDERTAMRLCQEALERGVFAQAIRPPTVPAGTSRLRLTAMASHTAPSSSWRRRCSPTRHAIGCESVRRRPSAAVGDVEADRRRERGHELRAPS